MGQDEQPRGVVITGAAGDLGGALAASYAAEGFVVYGADIRPVAAAESIVAIETDVTDRDAVNDLARRAGGGTRLCTWINCAGIFAPARIRDADPTVWERIIAVNLTGTFHGCAAALGILGEAGGGRIVNVGSLSGHVGGTGVHPAYGASKAGVHALTKSYALEGARFGICCNAVAPGVLEGEMGSQFSEGQRQRLIDSNPLRRLGTMDDVVDAVRFLADPVRAAYLNGVILPINGGAYMPS
ncbi:MAG: SDR family oxidoreductase [Alphaproteobacteria bacterium]|nr:SDR family oxidoreductase [Alphaproteobacteria bacterium]